MIKKNFLLIILILVLASSAYPQLFKVNLLQPPPFQFKVEDFWRITLENNSTAEVKVYLVGKVTVLGTNDLIARATSSQFTFQTGNRLLNASELGHVEIDTMNDIANDALYKTGSFETGYYKICVYVVNTANDTIAQDCLDIQILNMTRIDLLSPEDKDEVLYLLPQFAWLPPTPLPAQGQKITYQFQIVEILNLESPQYAFEANPIYFSSYSNITTTLFQYPIAAKPLINGTRYAWKIVTYVSDKKYIESPVWEFVYNGDNRNNKEINKQIRAKLNDSIKVGSIDESEASGKMNVSESKHKLADDLPLPKSITTKLDYEFNDLSALNSEMPRNFGSINVDIEGAPFNVNLYFDTKEMELKQGINSLGLFLDPEKLKDKVGLGGSRKKKVPYKKDKSADNPLAKFFSFFETFGLGDTYPEYTSSTVSGTKMTGADIAINPGIFFLQLSGLNNLEAIPGSTFSRKMLAGRIGVGGKDKSHFHFIMMKAWDNPNSLNVDTSFVSPQENIVSGVDGSWSLLKDQIVLRAALNGSTYTRDLYAPPLTGEALDKIPAFVRNLNDKLNLATVNMSIQYDFMYEFGARFISKDFGTDFEATFKHIGPGYFSLAAQNVRTDVQALNFRIANPFFKKKVQAAAYVQLEENNLLGFNSTTSKSTKLGFNLKVNFPGYPYLIADYRPNTVSNEAANDSVHIGDSLLFRNTSDVLSVISGMNFTSKAFVNSLNLVLTNMAAGSKNDTFSYSVFNLAVSNSLTLLKLPLTISGSAGYTRNKRFQSGTNSFLFDFSAAYTFFEKWNNTLGASYYTEENSNTKSTVYFNSSYPVGKYLSIDFNLLKDFYSEKVFQYGDRNNLIIRAGISSTLK